ncbi:unnamed protein product [Tetraodon nigroviridis]|uniref:(spotted green pufferfish) hypothetical protein n=1 Tax=Tetraodon nigroviridis TaxID=99883 RepID=Q4RPH6_TETNG|nr:unnamed protein product [Tetraodon nigroviridis]
MGAAVARRDKTEAHSPSVDPTLPVWARPRRLGVKPSTPNPHSHRTTDKDHADSGPGADGMGEQPIPSRSQR